MHPESRLYGLNFRFVQLFAFILVLVALTMSGMAKAQAKKTAADKLILALGDSLTAGYQLKAGEGFVPQLEAALRAKGHKVRVHNAGVSGDTTVQGKARVGWVLNSLKQKPDLAIVALGANDMLRGQPVAQANANLDQILADFKKRDIPVLLAGMLAAPNLGPNYGKAYNSMYPALAKKYGATFYPFFLKGVAGNPKLQLADKMHPNKEGVAVMVRNILPTVEQALAKNQNAKAPAKKAP